MSENIWEELARSPLDPDPDARPSPADWIAPGVLAVVAGLVVGFIFGNSTSDPAPTTVASIATSSMTIPSPPDPIIPIGYTAAGEVSMRAIASYSQGGNLYVVVDQAVRSDLEPDEVNAFYVGEWTLTGDGLKVVASHAIDSIVSPGVKLVEFPGVVALPISNPQLTARQATEMVVRSGCNGCGATAVDAASGEIVLDGLARPYSLTEALLIPVGDGITLSVDQLEVTDDWGYATWHIVDDNDASVRIELVVTFVGTDDPGRDGINPTRLVPPQFFGVSQQRPTSANPDPFVRQDSVGLDRTGELVSSTNQPTSLVLEWSIEWRHPVGDLITLPLADIVDLGIID